MFIEYDEGLFADREEEIKFIQEMVRSLNQGLPLKERTIFVFGPMGIGKTWLLRRLCTVLKEEAFTFYLDLSEKSSKEPLVEHMISQIANQLEKWGITTTKGEEASLEELSRWLSHDVNRLLEANPGKSFLLCLDSIDQVQWELLSQVEDYIMVPLLRLQRVLLVVGGRRYIYPWRAPEIRIYHKTMLLKKFNLEDSKKQVEKIKGRRWEEIEGIPWLREALGYPWLNYLVATEENLERIPEKVINEAFKDLPQGLLPVVEQLSVLRYFDETRMQLLVNSYADKPFRERQELVRKLMDLGLARWDEEKELGYILDSGLRIILETKLRRDNPEKWQELHQKAWKFYEEWAKNPKYGKIWEEDAKYHLEKLEEEAKCQQFSRPECQQRA